MKRLLAVAAIALATRSTGAGVFAATVGSIHGTVTNAAAPNRPLAGARIEIVSPSVRYAATSDARGFYSLVGVLPGSYVLTASARGYKTFAEPGVAISQDSAIAVDVAMQRENLKEIGHVTARSATFPVQPHQPSDVYVVGDRESAQLGGIPSFENESQLINTLPGITPVGGSGGGLIGGFPAIRGGLSNQIGYEIDGIDATDPIVGYFINNSIVNGAQSIDVTAGPGDASKGGSGSGYVNVVSKAGTYPASGYFQVEDGGPAFEHNIDFEFGDATPDKRYSIFLSGRYARDFGGGTAPPYGNTYGGSAAALPDTIGQAQFESTNDTLVNALIHFGRNDANTIQLWGDWGSNREVGGYGIDPSTYPYYTGNPSYSDIYQYTPVLLSAEQTKYGIPIVVASPAPLTNKQTDALMPFFPGQGAVDQAIGTVPNEITTFDMLKLAYSRQLGSNGFVNAALYRTQNDVIDDFSDPDNALFGYGLPAVGFQDNYTTRASQNTGIAVDVQEILGERNVLTFGSGYRFSRADLQGYVVSPTLFFAGPTIADFLPVDPYTGKPGAFDGQRYPAFNEIIDSDMYRTNFYANDQLTLSDRALLQFGLRYDQQVVPTAQGNYEASALDPRAGATWTLGKNRDTVLRGSYGHAATFAPLFQLVTAYNPPASYRNDPATLSICGGPAANFKAPCANYYDELVNAWWNGFGVDPVNFSGPQESDSYDFSVEHAFGRRTGVKLTVFDRRDYGVIVNSEQVTFTRTGEVIPGTTAVTNQGKAQTAGLELQVDRQIAQGLSAILNATYTNAFVNYVTSNAFRPSVQPALLDTGAVFHPTYLSPDTAALTLDYRHGGWQFDPIFRFVGGFPIGIWSQTPAFVNGVPMFVPNTNLYNTFNSQYCYYVDPQTPGTPGHPRIIGSTGGACSANATGLLSHAALFINLHVSRQLSSRVAAGLEIQNLLQNYANYPYYNPGYVNNGYGAFGPGSGANPVFGLPGAIKAYPSGPFFSVPSGLGRQITLYTRISL